MTFHRTAAVLLTAVVAAACGGSKSKPVPNEFLTQAMKLERADQQEAAIEAYRHALEQSPDSFDGHYGIARALDLTGHYDEARQHFGRAIELAPDGVKEQALRMMGIAWTFVGNADEATQYFRQVFDRRMAAGSTAAAAEEANEIGRVHLELGHVDLAEQWYRTGHDTAGHEAARSPAQIDLDDLRWAHAEARIAARRGRDAIARRHLATAERLVGKGGNDDQRLQLAYLRGYIEFYSQHDAAAVRELEKADQQDPSVLFLLAEANERLGHADRAHDYYSRVMASSSHAVNAAFVRAAARQKLAS